MNILLSAVMLTVAVVAFAAFHVVAMCFVFLVALIAPIVKASMWSGRSSIALFRRRAASRT